MALKQKEKDLAVKLRKQGKTYNEILKEVPVAKSTLSLWLREVGLSKVQKQKLTAKKKDAQQRGGDRRREMRLEEERLMRKQGIKDIESLSERDLFLIGVALYWAEGTKRSGTRPGSMVDFANSDPQMIRLFVQWLVNCCSISKSEMEMRLHLHINHKYREFEIKKYWSDSSGLSVDQFAKTLYKRHNPRTVRTKIGDDYFGLVSIRVKMSTKLNRRIMGWIYAIIATQK